MLEFNQDVKMMDIHLGTIVNQNKKPLLTVKNVWLHAVAKNNYMAIAVGVTNNQKGIAFGTRNGIDWQELIGVFKNDTKGLIFVKYDEKGFILSGPSLYGKSMLRFQTNDGQEWTRLSPSKII